MLKPKRKLYRADMASVSEEGFKPKREEATTVDANVMSSLGDDGLHYPCIDFDFTAYTVPSSTPGNVHLYIERGLTWEKYEALLVALVDAGLLEPGYVSACVERKMTFVRLPWVAKEGTPTTEAELEEHESRAF